MMEAQKIFVFRDYAKPTVVYGYVPERSSAALPRDGAEWREVVGSGFVPTPEPRSRTDVAVREGIQIRGYAVVDYG
jgi:hypothetical protein